MSTDAIVLLKADHKEIREQFTRFAAAGENATAAKGKIVDKIVELLTVHTYIENEVMYPEVRTLATVGLNGSASAAAHPGRTVGGVGVVSLPFRRVWIPVIRVAADRST